MKRLILTLALATVAAVAAACGASSAAEPPASVDPNAVQVVAKDIKFTTAEVSVPAGKPFQVSFANQDGAPHNVSIFTDESATTQLFQGEIFGGPATKVYQVPALQPGIYFFRCDVHPDMRGTIVAK